MRNSRMSRWFAAGITGTLFALLMLALAAPVAADGLVTRVPGQDPNSNVIVVSSPAYANNGTAAIPANINNGFSYCTANACYPPGGVCTVAGCGTPIYYGGCTVNGCAVPNCAVTACVAPAANCNAYGCGTLGYTAAGPIVAVDNNGNPVVYDVRGGTFDTYTTSPNGVVCEADSTGACEKGSTGT